MVILEEGNLPHPRCFLCDMLVPWKALNRIHRRTAQCTRGAEQKRQGLAEEEEREVITRVFSAYGRPLEMATSLKYLGRVISETDNEWTAVVRILEREKTVWSRISRILSREGSKPLVSGFFFKAVIQAVLLFGAETWVATPCMGKALGGFQTQVKRRLTGQLLWRKTEGKRRYNSAAVAREAAGFLTIEEYVRRRQNTVAQYIAT